MRFLAIIKFIKSMLGIDSLVENLSKTLLLFEGSIYATGTYNFLEVINMNYIFLNIVTAGVGTFRLRLSDYTFPFGTIILGYNADKEYIVLTINKSNVSIQDIAKDGIFQAEIKKYIYRIFNHKTS